MSATVRKSPGERLRYPLMAEAARGLPALAARGAACVVSTPGHLGDVLHAVPMLKALRRGMPGARIVWLVGPWSRELAQRYAGHVDEIRIFGPNLPNYARGRREWRQSAWHQWRLAQELRRIGVDVLIAPLDAPGRFLANAICPRTWAGIGERRPPRVRPEIATVVQPYEKDRYEAEAWCGLVRTLGLAAPDAQLDYAATPAERQAADEFLRAEGVDVAHPLVLIAPGSGWSGKNWLPERFGEVAAWLAGAQNAQVAWIGSPAEAALVPPARAGDFRWFGHVPLPVLTAAMARARLFVGNDGGLLHFAAAQGVPTVSIWGPTSPGKWGPQGERHRQIRKTERCAGCIYWDYRESCRHDRACMKAVATADVLAAIREVWGD
jgi:ADP-heptose:LPS heptosyltransferase